MPNATRRTLLEPPLWTNKALFLYHGTSLKFAKNIQSNGIDPANGLNPKRDFGLGFYTTTSLDQAGSWAKKKVKRVGDEPAVLEFQVNREDLAKLEMLTFVRWKPNHDDYWSFVFHCRRIGTDHRRPSTASDRFYDAVMGPVATDWQSRIAFDHMDQLSFHTNRSIDVLCAAGNPTITQV